MAPQAAGAVVVLGIHAEEVVHGLGDLAVRLGVDGAEAAAREVHEALYRVVAGARRAIVEGLGAVFLKRVRPFLGDDVERLVPRDALELAASALAGSPHGVFQALRAVDPFSHRAGLQAGPERYPPEFRIAVRVVVYPAERAVDDVAFDGACDEAAMAAALPDDLPLLGDLVGEHGAVGSPARFLRRFLGGAAEQAPPLAANAASAVTVDPLTNERLETPIPSCWSMNLSFLGFSCFRKAPPQARGLSARASLAPFGEGA